MEYLILYVLTRVKHATHRDLLSLPSIEMKDSSGIYPCFQWNLVLYIGRYPPKVENFVRFNEVLKAKFTSKAETSSAYNDLNTLKTPQRINLTTLTGAPQKWLVIHAITLYDLKLQYLYTVISLSCLS